MAIGGGPFGRDRLTDVVSALDYLNRALPTEGEFEAPVRRLGIAGLINVSSKGFKQTRRGRAMLKKFGLRAGVIKIMLELMKEWDGLRLAPAETDFRFELMPGEWHRAVDDFQVRISKRLAKFTK